MERIATCSVGTVVTIRPFPSFVNRTRLPVSVAAKFAPEIPASAERNFSRSALRAIFVSTWGSSEYGTPRRSAKSLPTWRRFLWIAGTMMWEGVSPSIWMMYSPRSVSTTSIPAASRWEFRSTSSETIDFPFTIRRAPRSARIFRMISRAAAASFAL